MNPTSNETASMELPPPAMEQPVAGANAGEQAPAPPERAPASSEKAPALQPPQVGLPPIKLPLPPVTPPAVPQDPPSSSVPTSSTSSTVIDDKDLIEKEWVNKAKQIVALNRDDPYKQSEELTMFKADYMKKHYDKNIKLSS